MNQDIKKNLEQALKRLQIADHMAYVSYTLINEKRLLLKIFEEIVKAIDLVIDSILDSEKETSKIKEKELKREIFLKKYSKSYLNNDQKEKIIEILQLNDLHKSSAMEFPKKEKIVIMSDNLDIHTLNIKVIKEYLRLIKEFTINTGMKILK